MRTKRGFPRNKTTWRRTVKVVVTSSATTVERVEQGVIFVPGDRKRDLLVAMLRDPALARVLVFTRTKHGADRVVRHLAGAGIEATGIHGNKSQPQRERALAAFRDGCARVLVATDIAARGTDVEGVSHVINFELPNCRRITCIALAAPRGRARRGLRSPSAAMRKEPICATSKS